MKEHMDRLTLKKKIVGYAWFCVEGIFYYRGQYDGYGTDIPKPDFDAWDIGIEVNDRWWFVNDKIEMEHDSWENTMRDEPTKVMATGIMKFDKYGWFIEKLTGQEWAFYDPESRNWNWEDLKLIGNIYDKEK